MSDHHKHSHHHNNQQSTVRLAATIILNVIITIAEYIGGILSGSLALLSDAGHNLSDVFSLMLGYAGEKVSQKKPSSKYTFGMKRFEVLIALINAISLIIIGIYILYESVQRFLTPKPIDLSIMMPVAIIGLLGNLFSIILLAARRHDSINLRAAFLHLFYDTISSIGVVGAAIVIYFTDYLWIDIIISLIIVLMIFWSSLSIIIESMGIFLQRVPQHLDLNTVYTQILTIPQIEDIHGLHIWSVSSREIFLSCHVVPDEKKKKVDTDTLIKEINRVLEKDFGISHTTIQIERDLCRNKEKCCG